MGVSSHLGHAGLAVSSPCRSRATDSPSSPDESTCHFSFRRVMPEIGSGPAASQRPVAPISGRGSMSIDMCIFHTHVCTHAYTRVHMHVYKHIYTHFYISIHISIYTSIALGEGGLASSAWHIDQMGRPPRLDVWACAQSNVQWWMSIRSAGGTCLSRYVPAYKTDEAGMAIVGAGGRPRCVGGASEIVGGSWRTLWNVGEGHCYWPLALV